METPVYTSTRKERDAIRPVYLDKNFSEDDFSRQLFSPVNPVIDYRTKMAEEGLFHKDQEYKNIRLIVGDETRYVPFALAHTNTETEIVILPPERMPYEVGWEFVLRHEMEHCINPGVSEHYTDLNAANRTRDYMRSNVRLKY